MPLNPRIKGFHDESGPMATGIKSAHAMTECFKVIYECVPQDIREQLKALDG